MSAVKFITGLAVAVLAAAPSGLASAQSGVVSIAVVDVTDRKGVSQASVRIGDMPTALTDSAGRAIVHNVPVGRTYLRIRGIGYGSALTEVYVTKDTSSVTIALSPLAARLPDVTVTERDVPPWLGDFESRRQKGAGHFVTPAALDSAHGSDLASILLRRVPGLRIGGPSPVSQFAYSTRGPNSLGGQCIVAVYVDGMRDAIANVAEIPLSLLGGVEYYSPGTVPVQYREPSPVAANGNARGGSAACGVLLLWTR